MTKNQKNSAELFAKSDGDMATFSIIALILLLIMPCPAPFHKPYIPLIGLYIIFMNRDKRQMNKFI